MMFGAQILDTNLHHMRPLTAVLAGNACLCFMAFKKIFNYNSQLFIPSFHYDCVVARSVGGITVDRQCVLTALIHSFRTVRHCLRG